MPTPLDYFSHPPGRGSSGNVIAALASAFIPGLGQLAQGRILPAVFFFLLNLLLWAFCIGWITHIWSCIDAALWQPM